MTTVSSDVTVDDFRQSITHRLATACFNVGYTIAHHKRALDYQLLDAHSLLGVVGLLYDDPNPPAMPRRFFGLMAPKKPRRLVLGDIWTSNEHRGANAGKWVFEVYGRDNLDRAIALANNLSDTFGVWIVVRLIQDQLAVETLPGDGYWD